MAEVNLKGKLHIMAIVQCKFLNKHFAESEETQQGHMRGQLQGVQSTKKLKLPPPVKPVEEEVLEEDEAKPPLPQHKQHGIFVTMYDMKSTMYTDQTGKFPHVSRHDKRYQVIICVMDSNYSWFEPVNNRTEGGLILTLRRALDRMKLYGVVPKHQVLDNKISRVYKAKIKESNLTYQLVPPDYH